MATRSELLANLKQVRPDEGTLNKLDIISKSNIGTSVQLDELLSREQGFLPAGTYNMPPMFLPQGKFRLFNYISQEEAQAGKVGHWVAIDNRDPSHIQYADPYGIMPDRARVALGESSSGYFSGLLKKSAFGRPIKVNHVQFQDLWPGDDACGMWASIFILHPDLNAPFYRDSIPSAYNDSNLEQSFLDTLKDNKPRYHGNLRIVS